MSGVAGLRLVFEFDSSNGPRFGSDETILISSLIEHILNFDVELRGVTIREWIVVMEHDIGLGWTIKYKLALSTIEERYRVVAHRSHVESDIGPSSNPLCRGNRECVWGDIQRLKVIRANSWGA